jgi:hypothetical protein
MLIDWSKMTPREIWEALKEAPKVAGPWMLEGQRLQIIGDGWMKDVAYEHEGKILMSTSPETEPEYPDRATADAALRAAGWLLVD